MKGLALGIFQDLQRRRLLPVAVLLVLVALVLPIVGLKSAEEPPPQPSAATAATAADTGGLPTPQQALNGNDKPLVTLAVLEESSNLSEFDSKNPFRPIDQVSAGGASDAGSPMAPDGVGQPTSGAGDETSSGESGGGSTGGSPTGGGQPTPPASRPPSQQQDEPKTEKKLTYALDLTIRGPKGLRSYRNLPKLSLLPASDNPLLVFLGVEDAGTKAVFLVDAKLHSVEGEGTCSPSPTECATLALAPGEEHVLANDANQTWTIRIVEVRETSVAKAAAAARKAQKRRARKATRTVGEQPVPRFIPPVITDLFTGGRS